MKKSFSYPFSSEKYLGSSTNRGIIKEGHEHPLENYPRLLGFKNEREFVEFLRNKVTVDLGSGGGKLIKDLRNHFPDVALHVIGIEPRLARDDFRVQKEIKNTQTTSLAHTDYVAASWLSLPFADKSIDVIISVWAFPFWAKNNTEVEDALKECARILKDGGEMRFSPLTNSPDSSPYENEDFFYRFGSVIKSFGLKEEIMEVENHCLCLSLKKIPSDYNLKR